MFYGYVTDRKSDSIYVITKPYYTEEVAYKALRKAQKELPRNIFLDMFCGNPHGVVFLDSAENIIPKNSLGIKIMIDKQINI